MEGLESALLESLFGGSKESRNKAFLDDSQFLQNEAAQAWREKYSPIPNLKEGDKVMWKSGCRSCVIPPDNKIVEVFRVITPPILGFTGDTKGTNHASDIYDFSLGVWQDSGNGEKVFNEYLFDSRRFERIEEAKRIDYE
jgi:hypothetical protein